MQEKAEAKRNSEFEDSEGIPDFVSVLKYLEIQADLSQENADTVNRLANSLKTIKDIEVVDNDAKPEKLNDSIIDYLWYEMNRISAANRKMKASINHLTKVIGGDLDFRLKKQ